MTAHGQASRHAFTEPQPLPWDRPDFDMEERLRAAEIVRRTPINERRMQGRGR